MGGSEVRGIREGLGGRVRGGRWDGIKTWLFCHVRMVWNWEVLLPEYTSQFAFEQAETTQPVYFHSVEIEQPDNLTFLPRDAVSHHIQSVDNGMT